MGIDPTMAQIEAKRRFERAIEGIGRGLSDILWRIVCAGESLPVAEKAARECLSLPVYPELTDAQLQRVAEVTKGFFKK